MKAPSEFQRVNRVYPDMPNAGLAAPRAAWMKVATVSITNTDEPAM